MPAARAGRGIVFLLGGLALALIAWLGLAVRGVRVHWAWGLSILAISERWIAGL